MRNELKRYIGENNLTQEELAIEIGIHKSTIKRILGTLSGDVSIFTKIRVAQFLDESISKKCYEIDELNTKHYSDKRNTLLFNLLDGMDTSCTVVEPFVGNGSLLPMFGDFKSIEAYDIIPQTKTATQRDTLLDPPSYKGRYVITNPPYLARNKAEDKRVFDKYESDDLYKAFIKSLMFGECEGGAMIIPLNFFTDENSEALRKTFLAKYRIDNLNIFKCQMFDYTKYNTCSFNFFLDDGGTNKIDTLIFEGDSAKHLEVSLEKNNGYRLFGEFYTSIPKRNISIDRYTNDSQSPSHISIKCIDGILESSKIKAEYVDLVEIGKISDRNIATLVIDKPLTEEQGRLVVSKFNKFIGENRDKYHNLIFTNFRENNRKRIGFDLAYDIIAMFIEEVVENEF
jgi:DNA-binding XRE family transcriptional regulator